MTYNTEEKPLRLQKYGRLVQNLVERVCAVENRRQRQAMAERVVKLMVTLNPQMRAQPGYMQTAWNHLAALSGYRLDIDYPCAIETPEEAPARRKLAYPGHRIRFRHYGHLLEEALRRLSAMERNAPGRASLIKMTGTRMRTVLSEWRGDTVGNDRIAADMELYTDGRVGRQEALRLLALTPRPQRRQRQNTRRFRK